MSSYTPRPRPVNSHPNSGPLGFQPSDRAFNRWLSDIRRRNDAWTAGDQKRGNRYHERARRLVNRMLASRGEPLIPPLSA
jgi:hypothetical protein